MKNLSAEEVGRGVPVSWPHGNAQAMLALADEPQGTLFGDAPDLDGAIRPAKVPAPGVARVLMPHRIPIELRPSDLESLLPAGHRARRVWDSVARADVSRRYAGIRAVAGGRGRTAMAPEILFTLWRYATLAGVGTARELARLTQAHDAYRWIGGGVRVNDHSRSDVRPAHTAALDGRLTDSVESGWKSSLLLWRFH